LERLEAPAIVIVTPASTTPQAPERWPMKIESSDFRVREGDDVSLKTWPTLIDPIYTSKKNYKKILAHHIDDLSEMQELLYASNRYAILLIFQAMDAAGKDGVIKHVMSG